MKIYVFDIDGTICTNTYGEYERAKPFLRKIEEVNFLYENGNYIKYFTARGSSTGKDWFDLTKKQLESWGAKYHELILGKPEADFYIDDKGKNAASWNWYENQKNKNDINYLEHDIKKDLFLSIDSLERCITDDYLITMIRTVSISIEDSLLKGGKVIFAGNGGSFADSQHLSAEFVSKLSRDRDPLPAIALGTNSSTTTAISNDYGFEYMFARELQAISNSNDIFLAFSTSGNSQNIINAIEKCIQNSINFFIFTGMSGGKCEKYKKNIIKVPSENTAIIQQMHITIGHIICKLAEKKFLKFR